MSFNIFSIWQLILFILIDNADMNIKASTTNKWLIDPDNQDGFALMWGGVKSNYGILVTNGNNSINNAINAETVSQNSGSFVPKKIAFQIKVFSIFFVLNLSSFLDCRVFVA